MSEKWITVVFSAVFVVIGFLLIFNENAARWGLSRGESRIWARLFGMERALKLTKYFFGPLVLVLGGLFLFVELYALLG